jgi:hypothetical protein
MAVFLRQSTASQEVLLGPFLDSTDGVTAETGLTIANTDIQIWKTGATSETSKNSGGATHIAGGRYYAVLDATDTNTIGPMRLSVQVSGALAVWLECCVLDEAVYDVVFGTTAPSTHTASAVQALVAAGAVASVTGNVGGNVVGSVGSVGSTVSANVVQISGDSTAADNAESFFDGTGYAGTNNVIPTVTTLTNAPSDSSGTTTLLTRLSSTRAGYLDNLSAGAVATASALATVDGIVDAILVDTNELQTNQGNWLTATGFSTHSAADVVTALGTGTTLTAIPWNSAWDAEVQSECTDALNAYDPPTKTEMDAAFTEIKGATFSGTTDSLEALRNRGDAAWTTATGFSTHSAADVVTALGTGSSLTALATASALATVDTVVDAILVDTAVIGAAGAGLTAIPWNSAWDAEVQSECADALTAYGASTVTTAQVNAEVDTALADIHLDHLLATAYDPASKPGASDALLNELVESDSGVSRFTANALEQAPSGTGASASAIADAVWDEVLSDHLTAGSTGASLNAAGGSGDPWTTTLPGSYTGSQAGKILADILTDTAEIGAAGVGLTNIGGFSTTARGQINAEADTALSDYGALKPTVAGRTLDVTSTGAAGIDWGNVENQGVLVELAQTEISRVVGSVSVSSMDNDAITAAVLASDAIAEIQSGLATASALATVDSNVDAILVDTGTTIPAQISGLNNLSAAQVNAEVDQALADYDGPTNAEMEARTLPAASYFDPATDTVARVTLVDTVTTNSDMRGTDNAATATALATVDGIVDDIKAKTDQLTFTTANRVDSTTQAGVSTLDAAGVRSAVGLASANLDTQLDALPTAAENAAAVLAAGDVDGFTLEETLKLCLAALAGKLSGNGTATVTIRSADDTANRIVATISAGNRTAVTLNAAG